MRRRPLRLLLLALLAFAAGKAALSQSSLSDVVGTPSDAAMYPIPGVGFVNLNNGNLHIEIPLRKVIDRDGVSLTMPLLYDNSVWSQVQVQSVSGGLISEWTAGPQANMFTSWYGSTIPTYSGQVRYSATSFVCGGPTGGSTEYGEEYGNWYFTDGNGTIHPFPSSLLTGSSGLTACGLYPAAQAVATDGSGYWLEVTNSTNAVVYDMHGNQVTGGVDTNGNIAVGYTDRLGRSIGLPSDFVRSAGTIYVWTDFGSGDFGPVAETVLSSLTLPGGREYSFQYDDAGPPNSSGDFSPSQQGHYGALTGITLPTGGHISITNEAVASAGDNINGGLVVKQITTPDGTWSFSYANGVVTATAPVDPNSGLAAQTTKSGYDPIATTVSTYSGTATGTPLRAVLKQYSGPGHVSSVTTTLNGVQSSKVAYTYADMCAPRIATKKEYDSSGNLLRETDTTYKTSASDNTNLCEQQGGTPTWTDPYLQGNHHIIDIPSSVTVYGPGGCCSNPVAQTNYTYDSTTLSTTSGSIKGVAGGTVLGLATHDDTDFGSSMAIRGNPTVISKMTAPGTFITTQTLYYNILGEVVKIVDGNGNATNFDFTDNWKDIFHGLSPCISQQAFAYPTTITNALNQLTQIGYYSCDGSIAQVEDQNDIHNLSGATSYTYDGLQRVVGVNSPDDGYTQVNYSGSALPEVITTTVLATPNPSQVSTTTLDGLGRTVQTQLTSDPAGADIVDTAYDSLGRVASVSNPYRSTSDSTYGMTYYSYDALGRMTKKVDPTREHYTCGLPCNPYYTQLWSYSGNTVTFSDENHNQWQRTSDALGRLTQVLEPSPTSTTPTLATNYTYDALDDLITVNQIGASGETPRARSFTYDGLSRLVTASNPETGTICYGKWSNGTGGTCGGGYDANGNLLYKSTPAPNAPTTSAPAVTVTSNHYDPLNRLLTSSHSDQTPEEMFTYDTGTGLNLIGHLTFESLTDPTGKVLAQRSFTQFDPMGRLMTESQCVVPNCPGTQYTPSYTYDLAGNVHTASNGISSQPITLTYSYDGANHLQQISSSLYDTADSNRPQILFQASATASQPTYTPAGALTYAQYGYNPSTAAAAIVLTRSYDKANRVVQQSAQAGATTLYSFTLPNGTYSYDGVGNLHAVNDSVGLDWTFNYDDLNRLSAANGAGSLAGQGLGYTYDSFGNRKTQSVTGSYFQQYAASANYNANNQATSTNLAAAVGYDQAGNILNDGVNTYAIDAESRVCSYHTSVLNENWTNVYDAESHRVAKGEVPSGSSCYTGTGFVPTETDVLGQSGEQFSTLNSSGWVRTNVYANGQLLATYEGNQLYFALNDWLGTKRVVTNGTGQVASTFQSLWFGDASHATTSNDPSDHHYTGQLHDTQSGLDYFGARYYASTMGRFMSPDPSGLLAQNPADPQSWNLYAYARNNPLINIDPTGLDCVYANDAGNAAEEVDHNSNAGECGQNGGTWAPGYVDENWVHFNNNTNMFQVGSVDGGGNSATVDYTNFSAGAQTDANGNCLSGCGGYGFSSANANWLQGQLVGNSNFSGLDGYIQFLTGREEPLGGGLANQLVSGPLDPSQDHWAGPGGFGPPGGQGDWAASVHDFNFSQNGPAPGQGITIGMYFNPTLSPATSRALIQSNNQLIRNAGGIQSVKMGMFFGVVNAFQYVSHIF